MWEVVTCSPAVGAVGVAKAGTSCEGVLAQAPVVLSTWGPADGLTADRALRSSAPMMPSSGVTVEWLAGLPWSACWRWLWRLAVMALTHGGSGQVPE